MLNLFFNRQQPQQPMPPAVPQHDAKGLEFDRLATLDPERLVGDDLNARVAHFQAIAKERNIDWRWVNRNILRQIIFTPALRTGGKLEQAVGFIFQWGSHLGFTQQEVEQEIQEVLTYMQGQAAPASVPASKPPTKPKQPKTQPPAKQEPRPVAPVSQEPETQRILTPMEQVGEAIVAGYRANKLTAVFDAERSFGDGPRCRRYVFTKPVDVKFSNYENLVGESLSNAGLDPERDIWFSRLANNQFEIQVAKHVSEWQRIALLDVLIANANFQAKPANLDEMINGIQSGCSFRVNDRLQAVFAIDVDSKLTHLDLSSGCAIVGASDSGKSTGIKSILNSLMLTCPNFRAAYFDLKDGLTLARFDGLASTWEQVATTVEGSMDLFDSLENEKIRRGKLLKKYHVENIIEYNSLGEEPLDWLPIVIEEVALLKQQAGADWTEEKLSTIAQSWRCYGMPLLAVTQYPTQKLSIGPGIRMNMGAAVAFRGTEGLGELAFGESSVWNKKVARLTGAGDCIIKQSGAYVRAQCLYTDGPHLNKLIELMKRRSPSIAPKASPVLNLDSNAVHEFNLLFGEVA